MTPCPLCHGRGHYLAIHAPEFPGDSGAALDACAECAGSGFTLPPASHPGWGRLAQALIAQEASLATPRGEA